MKVLDLYITEVDAKSKVEEKLNELRFEKEGNYLPVRLIFSLLPEETQLYEFLKWLNGINEVMVMAVTTKQDFLPTPTILFGDVDEKMTIYTERDIRICGEMKGKLFSTQNIRVYANAFTKANIFLQNEHFFIEEEKNYTVFKNDEIKL